MPRRLASVLAAFALLMGSVFTTSVVEGASPPTATACANRSNNTAALLLPCVRTDDLWKYMQAFEAIAEANPGPDGHASRNSGEPGYRASADYVANLMQSWGYNVTMQTYQFTYYAYRSTPVLSEISPASHSYVLATDWNPGRSTGVA